MAGEAALETGHRLSEGDQGLGAQACWLDEGMNAKGSRHRPIVFANQEGLVVKPSRQRGCAGS